MAYVALGAVAADLACLIAWLAGQTDTQHASFWVELWIALIPLPFATVIMFWIRKNRTIKQTHNQVICSGERDFINKRTIICFLLIAMTLGLYFTFGTPERIQPCGLSWGACAFEDRLLGDRNYVYSSITLTALVLNVFGSALILNLSTIYRNRNSKEPARTN